MEKGAKVLLLLFLISGLSYYLFVDSLGITGNVVDVKIESVYVERAIDGDTLELNDSRRVRMLSVNTPESNERFYHLAKEFSQSLEGQEVLLESFGEDKYGRVLGYIFYNGSMHNQKLVLAGLAHFYSYERDEYSDRILEAEKVAREDERGIWKKSDNYGCLVVREFEYFDEGDEKERLVLENVCGVDLQIEIKDDATHIYFRNVSSNSEILMETQNIWNDGGDSLYVWDNSGLLIFERY